MPEDVQGAVDRMSDRDWQSRRCNWASMPCKEAGASIGGQEPRASCPGDGVGRLSAVAVDDRTTPVEQVEYQSLRAFLKAVIDSLLSLVSGTTTGAFPPTKRFTLSSGRRRKRSCCRKSAPLRRLGRSRTSSRKRKTTRS